MKARHSPKLSAFLPVSSQEATYSQFDSHSPICTFTSTHLIQLEKVWHVMIWALLRVSQRLPLQHVAQYHVYHILTHPGLCREQHMAFSTFAPALFSEVNTENKVLLSDDAKWRMFRIAIMLFFSLLFQIYLTKNTNTEKPQKLCPCLQNRYLGPSVAFRFSKSKPEQLSKFIQNLTI